MAHKPGNTGADEGAELAVLVEPSARRNPRKQVKRLTEQVKRLTDMSEDHHHQTSTEQLKKRPYGPSCRKNTATEPGSSRPGRHQGNQRLDQDAVHRVPSSSMPPGNEGC